MLPYKSLITIDRKAKHKIALQISNQFIRLIKGGKLQPKALILSSRKLAAVLEVNRNTVIAAYDDLEAQGWIESKQGVGYFVNHQLPVIQTLNSRATMALPLQKANFTFSSRIDLHRSDKKRSPHDTIIVDDGLPDTRIAPVVTIAKQYRDLVSKSHHRSLLEYGSIYGDKALREALVTHLNHTRGFNISIDNVLITRGSQMGIYLSTHLLLGEEDMVIVGASNYISANHTIKRAGGRLAFATVDDQGINTDQIAELCKTHKIKAVYVTPHHHHPTTVTLSAARRMHLLQLAQHYQFAIIEDDYDYDFHYNHTPILPLASHDTMGNVLYIGALCKLIAPALRIGYLVGPKDIIDEAAQFRRNIDRQGELITEHIYAQLLKDGLIARHSKKALKLYKERRDYLAELFQKELSAYITYEIPEGGMAFWIELKQHQNWKTIQEKARHLKLQLPSYNNYNYDELATKGIRFGFASLTQEEMVKAVRILKQCFEELPIGR